MATLGATAWRAIAALLVLGISAHAARAEDAPPDRFTAAEMMEDLMYGHGTVGGPFTLTDQDGHKRSDTDFRGKLMIVIPDHRMIVVSLGETDNEMHPPLDLWAAIELLLQA